MKENESKLKKEKTKNEKDVNVSNEKEEENVKGKSFGLFWRRVVGRRCENNEVVSLLIGRFQNRPIKRIGSILKRFHIGLFEKDEC